jgi:predicted small lipoprotein YifL
MKKTIISLLALALCLTLPSCGKKGADATKPIDQIKAEVAKMDVSQLHDMALSYKDTILSKQTDLEKVTTKLKTINPTELLGAKAVDLKKQMADIERSVSALKERFEIYYDQLKQKGGNLTGLEIK